MREQDIYTRDEIRQLMEPFIGFVKTFLELAKLPKIKLVRSIGELGDQPTFAFYNRNDDSIQVAYGNRHIADVQRSLAHEMVHSRQNQRGELKPGSGKTGSPEENQANAMAGEIMRIWAKRNPDLWK